MSDNSINEVNLPSRDEYLSVLNVFREPQYTLNDPWCKTPTYKCPKCDEGGMCKDMVTVCLSNPPKYAYKCNKCGYIDYI